MNYKNKISLTFDVEEHSFIISKDNLKYTKDGLIKILNLLEKKKILATFFVTGYFAEKEPVLVKKIIEKNHEIGLHGFKHVNHSKIAKEKLKIEIKKAKEKLEKICGKKINGFRAPMFKVSSDFAKILEELEFTYDSSLHPAIVPGKYYNFSQNLNPYNPSKKDIFKKGNLKLIEIPISVIPIIRFPISWWWMKNIGSWISILGTKINLKSRNVVLYFHPWEFVKINDKCSFHIKHNTGKISLKKISKFIDHFKKTDFIKMEKIKMRD